MSIPSYENMYMYMPQNMHALLKKDSIVFVNAPPDNCFLTVHLRIKSIILFSGSKDACVQLSPAQNYSKWGDTEFSKLRLNTRNLVVNTMDFTFSRDLGPNKIR